MSKVSKLVIDEAFSVGVNLYDYWAITSLIDLTVIIFIALAVKVLKLKT